VKYVRCPSCDTTFTIRGASGECPNCGSHVEADSVPAAESESPASGNRAGKTGCLAAALAAAVVIISLTLFVIAAAQK
jgi:hypothetical protein